MANQILEWYGYAPANSSLVARNAASQKLCPFVPGPCTKKGGACSVAVGPSEVPVCPKRLYFSNFHMLRRVAERAFGELDIRRDQDDHQPALVPGSRAASAALKHRQIQVGVFGQGWDGEVKLPPASPGGARYSVDFTLIAIDGHGGLVGIAPVEVQTIDTTGSYRGSLSALEEDRSNVPSKFGMNWENVNKRIIPQLISKGLLLQGERLCSTGLYFVTPEAVYDKIMLRLGGPDRFRELPPQPGSITFIRYAYRSQERRESAALELTELPDLTISTSDMSLAFISPQNLPPAGAYEDAVSARLR
ncbi:NotI family restriction endonuclease [Demequina globuliformis]|uniref:NotI family restriction endonuclease n=1 Tax=Demequina globuliformis TaxID=676202 RepID=UPI000A017F30|nr:NotI family restriction endonuclease [Demequina globuliformis]